MEPLLKLEKISTAYGQSPVLWDVDLSVPRGGALALIGRSRHPCAALRPLARTSGRTGWTTSSP